MRDSTDRTRNVLGNSGVFALAQASGVIVSLAVTPYVLSTLGIATYGLWILVGSVMAYVGLLQLGLGRGTIRFIAFHAARGELEVVRRIVSYGIVWHLAAAVLLTPVAWLIARFVLPHLSIPPEELDTARNVFLLVYCYAFFGAAIRPLSALVIGLHQMWLTSLATIASQLVYAVTLVVLLHEDVGIYALPAAAFVNTFVLGVTYYVTGRRLIGTVFGDPFKLDAGVRRDLLRFGSWFQVTNLARVVNNQTDAILIAVWVTVPAVGLYAIGEKIARLVQMIPLTVLPPLVPAVTSVHAGDDRGRVERSVLGGSRLLGLLTFGMAGFVLGTSPLIVVAWLGRSYPDVTTITALIVVAYVVNNLTGVGTTVLAAVGTPRYESEYAVVGMVLNIAVTLALAPIYGLYGVLVGTVIGIALCSTYFLWRFHRVMGLSLWQYLGTWLWRIAAATFIPTAAVFGLRSALPEQVTGSRGAAALALAVLAVVYAIVLLAALRLFRFLEARDLAVFERVLPVRLRSIATRAPVQFLFGGRA